MKIEVIRQRRKTVCLKMINADLAELRVPKTYSDKKIQEFLDEKRKWLESKSKIFKENEDFSHKFDLENSVYLFGEEVDKFNRVIIGFDDLSKKAKRVAIRKYYEAQFSMLEEIAKDLSSRTGLTYDKIRPINSIRVWGSYSSARVMKLNWKLLLLPKNLVEYVVCHELCHSKHMNHKPQFWNAVGKICPNYKFLRNELKKYGFLLKSDTED